MLKFVRKSQISHHVAIVVHKANNWHILLASVLAHFLPFAEKSKVSQRHPKDEVVS